jgi:hypothetical protein
MNEVNDNKIIKLDKEIFTPAGLISSGGGRRKAASKSKRINARVSKDKHGVHSNKHTTIGKNAILKHIQSIKPKSLLNHPLSDTNNTVQEGKDPTEFEGAKAFFESSTLKHHSRDNDKGKDVNENGHLDENNKPKYGCLKNGILPTFRMWKSTVKNRRSHVDAPFSHVSPQPPAATTPGNTTIQQEMNKILHQSAIGQNKPDETAATRDSLSVPMNNISINIGKTATNESPLASEAKHSDIAPSSVDSKSPPVYTTSRRRHVLGKKANSRKVSVLIPNNSTRKRIATEMENFGSLPISEIKEYLQKSGFIKSSAVAPNEKILRYMYENAKLIGADIVNKNYDNLLQNYLAPQPPTG